jgi:hypothetical protein
LFTGFVYLKWYKNDYRVIELNYPPEGSRIDSIHIWGEQYYSFPKGVQYKDYSIDNQSIYNNSKFNIIEKNLLVLRHDSSKGIRVIYTKAARFEDYIRAINLCIKHRQKRYLLLNDTLWITAAKSLTRGTPPPHFESFCGYRLWLEILKKHLNSLFFHTTVQLLAESLLTCS